MLNGQIRIGIYGGTFSPPHEGHIIAAREFLRQMELDLLYIIPAAIPPHKQIDAADDPSHRLEMCRRAFADVKGALVSDLEIVRGGKSYTVDTLRALSAPDRRLFLLMGTDMMLTLGDWRAPEEIFKLCYPVYMRREADAANDALIVAKNQAYLEKYGKIVRRIPCEFKEISSTEIRKRVAEGKSLAGLVPPSVESYIREMGLYGEKDNGK